MSTNKSLDDVGKSASASIVEMVEALECDYERLKELREAREDAESEGPTAWIYEHAEESDELAELEKAAGECESREEAEQRIQEDALSVEVRSGWYVPSGCDDARDRPTAEEFNILLSTGGPAVRIRGELDTNAEPYRAWLEVQDWGTPWTQYFDIDQDTLLTYARCFYFGEG